MVASFVVLTVSPSPQEAMRSPSCDKLYITDVMAEFPSDTFFPPVDMTLYKQIDIE